MATLSDSKLHELARKRVEFRRHLLVYFVINGALWALWWITGSGYIWPIWPTVGWGIGVIFHYIFDYRYSSFLSEEEEYKKIKNELKEESQG